MKKMLVVKNLFFYAIGLNSWREAVSRSHTAAQLAMALYVLESCVAWDKSIMKAVSIISSFQKEIIHFSHMHTS